MPLQDEFGPLNRVALLGSDVNNTDETRARCVAWLSHAKKKQQAPAREKRKRTNHKPDVRISRSKTDGYAVARRPAPGTHPRQIAENVPECRMGIP